MIKLLQKTLIHVLIASLLSLGSPAMAQAAIIGTLEGIESTHGGQDLARINAALAREQVRDRMEALGVDAAQVGPDVPLRPGGRGPGGSLGEALDQLATTRLLRKLRGRHHNLEEDLEHLQDVLEQTWPCKQHRPEMARQLLEDEIRHVRG